MAAIASASASVAMRTALAGAAVLCMSASDIAASFTQSAGQQAVVGSLMRTTGIAASAGPQPHPAAPAVLASASAIQHAAPSAGARPPPQQAAASVLLFYRLVLPTPGSGRRSPTP